MDDGQLEPAAELARERRLAGASRPDDRDPPHGLRAGQLERTGANSS
jgi:hypothetical protein